MFVLQAKPSTVEILEGLEKVYLSYKTYGLKVKA